MLARRVQRCSLVEGGNFPGSINAPITPPSKRMVRPGACSLCAKVAASSGMPTPAKTTCPSRSSRALITARSSLAVQAAPLVVIDAPPAAARLEQFVEAEQTQVLGPRLWLVEIALEVVLAALVGVLPYLGGVEIEMLVQRFVEAVALVRRRAERHLDDGVDGEKRDLGMVGRAADLVVRDDALGGQDHPVRRQREIEIHEWQPVDLRVAVGIAALDVDQCNIGVERRNQHQLLAGEGTIYLPRIGQSPDQIRAHHRTHRQERYTHRASPEAQAHRQMAPFLEARAV